MTKTEKTRIVKIGNSQGIRIPKPILEQLGFTEEDMMKSRSIYNSFQEEKNIVYSMLDKLLELPGCNINEQTHTPKNFTVKGHELFLFGTCPECKG